MFDGFDGWLRAGDPERPYTVSELIDHCNFTLDREFGSVLVEGEVASFKINQGKWVFFDLKDADGVSTLSCFLPLSSLGVALSDGLKVRLRARPSLTKKGRFSLTVRSILPVGEGSIKKTFELLKRKLTAEGLFDPTRKRPLPTPLSRLGVISSTAAAGYRDFLKILDNRWGGLQLFTVNTQVQGLSAADQIIAALNLLNQRSDLDAIVIIRGGGSADDLAVFNDERLVRAIAASRLPVVTGIGHEVDETLADLAADLRASTPSNAAERLTPDRQAVRQQLTRTLAYLPERILTAIDQAHRATSQSLLSAQQAITSQLALLSQRLTDLRRLLASLNPEQVLRQGYAILSGKLSPGTELTITTYQKILTAEITNVKPRPQTKPQS